MKQESVFEKRAFWPTYWAINKARWNKTQSVTDPVTGKEYRFHMMFSERFDSDPFMKYFEGFLWMSPVFSAVFFAGYFGTEHPIAYISAGLFLIVYHFAAMDFIIKGPFLEITPVKHGFFRRKHQK